MPCSVPFRAPFDFLMLDSGESGMISGLYSSGFKSKNKYRFLWFRMKVKLAPGDTEGVVMSYYVRSICLKFIHIFSKLILINSSMELILVL